jgi:hypothetical protein
VPCHFNRLTVWNNNKGLASFNTQLIQRGFHI